MKLKGLGTESLSLWLLTLLGSFSAASEDVPKYEAGPHFMLCQPSHEIRKPCPCFAIQECWDVGARGKTCLSPRIFEFFVEVPGCDNSFIYSAQQHAFTSSASLTAARRMREARAGVLLPKAGPATTGGRAFFGQWRSRCSDRSMEQHFIVL